MIQKPDMSQPIPIQALVPAGRHDSRAIYNAEHAHELIFAVVGHVGSGTSEIAEQLQQVLSDTGTTQVHILKASDTIRDWAIANGETPPARPTGAEQPALNNAKTLQELGDKMRASGDHAAVARALVKAIVRRRAAWQGQSDFDPGSGNEVTPDGTERAFILDSLRHPAEVDLLRRLYGGAFILVGVVCDEAIRSGRISRKFRGADARSAEEFMRSDAHAPPPHGQRVSQAFYLADFFLDNTAERKTGENNPDWPIPDQLRRLIQIIRHSRIMRPEPHETAMYFAHGAALRSACLSRQVGAALLDAHGNLIATGTNDVPRAGGGLYGAEFAPAFGGSQPPAMPPDGRCAYDNRSEKYCRNTREQNKIIDDLIDRIPELRQAATDGVRAATLRTDLRQTRIGSLLEFSRAVHAEMEALMAACRRGVSTVGSRMFVTTEPCHPCTRHLLSAGVDEVQYIEPYPKSLALQLHGDAITQQAKDWLPPSQPRTSHDPNPRRASHDPNPKMLFRPFVGVAPRLYARAFLKDRDLKDDQTGNLKMGTPAWGPPWKVSRVSYSTLEAKLCNEGRGQ